MKKTLHSHNKSLNTKNFTIPKPLLRIHNLQLYYASTQNCTNIYSESEEKVWASEVIKYSIEGNYIYPFKTDKIEEELQPYEIYIEKFQKEFETRTLKQRG